MRSPLPRNGKAYTDDALIYQEAYERIVEAGYTHETAVRGLDWAYAQGARMPDDVFREAVSRILYSDDELEAGARYSA